MDDLIQTQFKLISRSSREPCQPGEDGSHDWEPSDRQVSPQADDGQIEAA